MEPLLTKKFLTTNLIVFVFGIFVGKLIFSPKHQKDPPTLLKYNGNEVTMKDVNNTIGEKPGDPQNSIEYKKQVAVSIMRKRVIDDLANNEKLSTQDYILKVKKDADTNLTENEIDEFLAGIHLERKKLSKPQLDNVINNMKEHKRELFFNAFLDKKISEMTIEQK